MSEKSTEIYNIADIFAEDVFTDEVMEEPTAHSRRRSIQADRWILKLLTYWQRR